MLLNSFMPRASVKVEVKTDLDLGDGRLEAGWQIGAWEWNDLPLGEDHELKALLRLEFRFVDLESPLDSDCHFLRLGL